MTNTPLNPDALEAATRALFSAEREMHTNESMGKQRNMAYRAVEAYLAAQPVVQATSKPNQNLELVNRWQELRVLPIGSVVLDADDQLMRVVPSYAEGRNLFEVMGEEWTQDDRQVELPARVLYLPPN